MSITKELLASIGFTNAEFAAELGVKVKTVALWREGKATPSKWNEEELQRLYDRMESREQPPNTIIREGKPVVLAWLHIIKSNGKPGFHPLFTIEQVASNPRCQLRSEVNAEVAVMLARFHR